MFQEVFKTVMICFDLEVLLGKVTIAKVHVVLLAFPSHKWACVSPFP